MICCRVSFRINSLSLTLFLKVLAFLYCLSCQCKGEHGHSATQVQGRWAEICSLSPQPSRRSSSRVCLSVCLSATSVRLVVTLLYSSDSSILISHVTSLPFKVPPLLSLSLSSSLSRALDLSRTSTRPGRASLASLPRQSPARQWSHGAFLVFGVAGPAPDDARSGGGRGGHTRETRRDAECTEGEERESGARTRGRKGEGDRQTEAVSINEANLNPLKERKRKRIRFVNFGAYTHLVA